MGEESKRLGEGIELTGFRDIDASSMTVINRIIGNHAKRISELTSKMGTLHITLKHVHEREKSEKYEVHAKVLNGGRIYASEITERNLFVAVDVVLKKLVNELD